jgi:integrase/recombinase XerD
MKTTHSFSINFFLKKDQSSQGNAPIYVRITVGGKFVDISLKRRVRTSAWDQEGQKLNGTEPESKDAREKIRQMRNEIHAAYDVLRYDKQILSADAIKAKVEGIEEEKTTLLWLMTYHNTEITLLSDQRGIGIYRKKEIYNRAVADS